MMKAVRKNMELILQEVLGMMEVVLEVSLWNKVEDNRYQNFNVVFLCQYFAFASFFKTVTVPNN